MKYLSLMVISMEGKMEGENKMPERLMVEGCELFVGKHCDTYHERSSRNDTGIGSGLEPDCLGDLPDF